jgi:4-hydroxybenzoate polyprenyltransferase
MAALAAGSLGFAHAARSAAGWPSPAAYGVAWGVALGFFFQLRVADEYKDFAADTAYRPYRPVPRGLITLAELAWLALLTAGLQLALSFWLAPPLIWPLLAVWGYMALMRWEFGAGEWLRARPLLYLLTHMLILPLIFVYLTGCDWLAAGEMPAPGLGWLLAAAYANGIVFEIGRKLRAPEDEEPGVETYSVLWGRPRATAVWWTALAAAGICVTLAAWYAGDGAGVAAIAVLGSVAAAALAARYVQRPTRAHSKWLEQGSALWMLGVYGGLALLPAWAG